MVIDWRDISVVRFAGRYRWLSNFWEEPLLWRGVVWSCAEAAYQSAKHPGKRIRFVGLSGIAAKRLGNALPLSSEDWTVLRRVCVMRSVLRAKFADGSRLAGMLLDTGSATLIEGNTWGDEFWGVCEGRGRNLLGRLLMDRRRELWMKYLT